VYALVDAFHTAAVGLALVAGGMMIGLDGMTLGVLVLFVEALGRFFVPIRELSNKSTIFQSALVAAERIIELENEPETITAAAQPTLARFERELAFDDVHFRYGSGPDVLRGLSFTIRKGEHIAVVGHSGAGKSTLVKLLPRLYDVSSGRVTVDDVDVRSFDPLALRRLMVAVPQDVFLFATSLRENLRVGRPDATDEQLRVALRVCQAESLLDRPGGLDAVLTERGQSLSLGERQLVAMGRVLVSDPPIVILDEATASVDRQTERRLQVATESLLKGRTALIVAHRLSTIEKCDRILVLDQGKLIEEGTHAELLQNGGRYAILVSLQRSSPDRAP
jgi:ATP-binding cassette subfamily B protein